MMHTLGPWEVQPKWDDRTNGALVYAQNAGNYVASALYLGGTEQARANARLISAAPQLLEALQFLMGDRSTRLAPSEREKLARDAIAKATGAA